MIVGHLPAGYLITKALGHRREGTTGLMLCGLLASVLPDTDMLWFHLVDHGRHHHHDYVFHLPLFWLSLGMAAFGIAQAFSWKRAYAYILVATANLMVHMVLDTIAGGVAWLAPFSDERLQLVEISARYEWWVWSFIFHWTFLLELLMIVTALSVWKRSCPKRFSLSMTTPISAK